MSIPYATALESDLQRLFIQYRPQEVIRTWTKVLGDFRAALQEVDTPVPTKIELKNTIAEPVLGPVQSNPASFHDKDAQKAKLKAHRDVVQKKREELAAQGVIPETQLTEENLKKWIQQESKTYWTIAEMTGCNDNYISNLAKSKNILSPVAMMFRKRRAKM
jgi:hypothetical protein